MSTPKTLGPKRIDQLPVPPGPLSGNEYFAFQYGQQTGSVQLAQVRDYITEGMATPGPTEDGVIALMLSISSYARTEAFLLQNGG